MAPQITFPDLDDGATYRVPQQTLQFRLQGDEMLSWTRHKHTLSFGGEVQSIDADFNLGVFQQGNIIAVEDFPDFDRNGDGKVDDNDLLFAVGLRSSTPTRPLDLPNNDNYHFALFAQDDWKVIPKLTLNLGLRWEMDTNLNNLSWYGQRNPIVQSFYQGTRHRDYNNWGPRVGFNFAFNPNLSMHGGYGIYYDRITLEIMSLEKGFDGRALALNVTAGNVTTDPNGVPIFLNQDGTFRPGAPQVLSSPFSGFLFTGAGRCRHRRHQQPPAQSDGAAVQPRHREANRPGPAGEGGWRAQSRHALHHRAAGRLGVQPARRRDPTKSPISSRP